MKKTLLVLLFAGVLATGSVFADHPSGWGLGVLAKWSGSGYWDYRWHYPHDNLEDASLAFALKAPSIPIYWGLSVALHDWWYSFGVQGDFYIIDIKMVPAANLHFFLGIGFFSTYYNYTYNRNRDYTASSLRIGLRVPVGVSFQPTSWFEVFTNFAPDLAVNFDFEGRENGWTYQERRNYAVLELFPFEIGVRFWLK
jgi:hypothetical protein